METSWDGEGEWSQGARRLCFLPRPRTLGLRGPLFLWGRIQPSDPDSSHPAGRGPLPPSRGPVPAL